MVASGWACEGAPESGEEDDAYVNVVLNSEIRVSEDDKRGENEGAPKNKLTVLPCANISFGSFGRPCAGALPEVNRCFCPEKSRHRKS